MTHDESTTRDVIDDVKYRPRSSAGADTPMAPVSVIISQRPQVQAVVLSTATVYPNRYQTGEASDRASGPALNYSGSGTRFPRDRGGSERERMRRRRNTLAHQRLAVRIERQVEIRWGRRGSVIDTTNQSTSTGQVIACTWGSKFQHERAN